MCFSSIIKLDKLKQIYDAVPIYIRWLQFANFYNYFKSASTCSKKQLYCLDAGSGNGWISYKLQKSFKEVNFFQADFFIPKSAKYLNNFVNSDITKLPFEDNMFDCVLLSSVLQVVEDPISLLEELNRVTKREGALLLTVPLGYPLIKNLFKKNKFYFKMIFGVDSYDEFLLSCNKKFKILGNGYYSYESLRLQLESSGYKILESYSSLSILQSLLFELNIVFRSICRRRSLTSKLDYFYYLLKPVDFLIQFMLKNRAAVELYAIAQKV